MIWLSVAAIGTWTARPRLESIKTEASGKLSTIPISHLANLLAQTNQRHSGTMLESFLPPENSPWTCTWAQCVFLNQILLGIMMIKTAMLWDGVKKVLVEKTTQTLWNRWHLPLWPMEPNVKAIYGPTPDYSISSFMNLMFALEEELEKTRVKGMEDQL